MTLNEQSLAALLFAVVHIQSDWRCEWRSHFNHYSVCTGRVLQPEAGELQMRSRAYTIHNGWERFTPPRRSEDLALLGWACVCMQHTRNKASWVETAEWARRRNKVHEGSSSAAKWCDFQKTLIPAVADGLQRCWLSNVGSRWPSSVVVVTLCSDWINLHCCNQRRSKNRQKRHKWAQDWCWCYCVCLCPQILTSVQRAWLSATTTPAVSTCPAGTTVNAEVVSMTMAPTCSMGAPALVSIHWIGNSLITAWITSVASSSSPFHPGLIHNHLIVILCVMYPCWKLACRRKLRLWCNLWVFALIRGSHLHSSRSNHAVWNPHT